MVKALSDIKLVKKKVVDLIYVRSSGVKGKLNNNYAKLKKDTIDKTWLGVPEDYVECWMYAQSWILTEFATLMSASVNFMTLMSTIEETLVLNWLCS